MNETRTDEYGIVRCAVTDDHKRLMVLNADHAITIKCLDCDVPGDYDVLASTEWYDSHSNLELVARWCQFGENGTLALLENPWDFEAEFEAARTARDHEAEGDGEYPHSIERYRVDDTGWECANCDERFATAEQVSS